MGRVRDGRVSRGSTEAQGAASSPVADTPLQRKAEVASDTQRERHTHRQSGAQGGHACGTCPPPLSRIPVHGGFNFAFARQSYAEVQHTILLPRHGLGGGRHCHDDKHETKEKWTRTRRRSKKKKDTQHAVAFLAKKNVLNNPQQRRGCHDRCGIEKKGGRRSSRCTHTHTHTPVLGRQSHGVVIAHA